MSCFSRKWKEPTRFPRTAPLPFFFGIFQIVCSPISTSPTPKLSKSVLIMPLSLYLNAPVSCFLPPNSKLAAHAVNDGDDQDSEDGSTRFAQNQQHLLQGSGLCQQHQKRGQSLEREARRQRRGEGRERDRERRQDLCGSDSNSNTSDSSDDGFALHSGSTRCRDSKSSGDTVAGSGFASSSKSEKVHVHVNVWAEALAAGAGAKTSPKHRDASALESTLARAGSSSVGDDRFEERADAGQSTHALDGGCGGVGKGDQNRNRAVTTSGVTFDLGTKFDTHSDTPNRYHSEREQKSRRDDEKVEDEGLGHAYREERETRSREREKGGCWQAGKEVQGHRERQGVGEGARNGGRSRSDGFRPSGSQNRRYYQGRRDHDRDHRSHHHRAQPRGLLRSTMNGDNRNEDRATPQRKSRSITIKTTPEVLA